jgi:hypothetical protein
MDEKLQPWGGKKKLTNLSQYPYCITFDGIDQSTKFIAWMKKIEKNYIRERKNDDHPYFYHFI